MTIQEEIARHKANITRGRRAMEAAGGSVCLAVTVLLVLGTVGTCFLQTCAFLAPWLPPTTTFDELFGNLPGLSLWLMLALSLTGAAAWVMMWVYTGLIEAGVVAYIRGHGLQALLGLAFLASVTGCTTAVPSPRPEHQEVMVTQTLDGGYVRGQQTALRLGWPILRTHDAAWAFVMRKPTGEELTFRIARMALGCLITIDGPPGADVREFVVAYQAGG